MTELSWLFKLIKQLTKLDEIKTKVFMFIFFFSAKIVCPVTETQSK